MKIKYLKYIFEDVFRIVFHYQIHKIAILQEIKITTYMGYMIKHELRVMSYELRVTNYHTKV